MSPGSAHGLGRKAPQSSRIAAIPGLLAVLLAVAAAPASAQQSSPGTVQAPSSGGTPSGSGAQSVPGSQGQSGGGDLRIETPGRDGHCSSKVPTS